MKENNLKPIQDKYVGTVELFGNWGWSGKTGPMALYPETLWTASKKPAFIKYMPKIEAVGMVRISAFMVGNSEKQNDREEYIICHADGTDKVYVDLSNYKNEESDWLVLGTYRFDGSGKEYVQLNHNGAALNTRAATIRFEILNDAAGGVWQYLYVGPQKQEKQTDEDREIIQLNRFSDLKGYPYRKEIERAYYYGLLEVEGDAFDPNGIIPEPVFTKWLSKMCHTDCENMANDNISLETAIIKIQNEIQKMNINLEWLDGCTDIPSVIQKIKLFKQYPELNHQNAITRGEAAVVLYVFYLSFLMPAVAENEWKLTFSDDFEGDALNEEIWESENDSPSHILSSRWAKNVSVRDSVMHLKTIKEKIEAAPEKEWTTGNVWVKPEYFSQYGGYWQASMKINAAKGINNAFWMIGNGNEIDIVEAHYKNSVHTNYHFEGIQHSETYYSPFDLSEDFHIYALEWNENELIYYFDGKEIARKGNLDAHHPLYPFFSTAVINWAGGIPDSADGCSMQVDWIRIYDRKK